MSDSDSLFLDEENEVYGYGVFNVHANCFIDLPETSEKRPSTPDHIKAEKDEKILNRVANYHQLDDTSHLRVVEVRLSNDLDEKAAEVVQ